LKERIISPEYPCGWIPQHSGSPRPPDNSLAIGYYVISTNYGKTNCKTES